MPSHTTHPRARHGWRRQQGGAATLIVVMLLFFIMSMVAAYTSRNLIFEQRTSANQYRSSQAFEAAEAGLEWAIAQLNAGRMTNTCGPSTTDTDPSFSQRYLNIDSATGLITPRVATLGSVLPRCVFDSSAVDPASWTWSCACPLADTATAALAAPGGTGPSPAFVLRFRRGDASTRQDLIQLDANSCTRLDNACTSFTGGDRGGSGDGVASTSLLLALRGALTRPPAAALSVAGALTLPGGSALALSNQDASVGGATLHTTGAVPAGLTLTGLPGVPPASSTLSDTTLTPEVGATGLAQTERTFGLFFGVFSDPYFRQPGMVEIDCSVSCNAAAVNLALLRNPGRAIRLRGTGMLTIDVNIGSAAAPALLIAEGPITFATGTTVVGMIYGRPAAWAWTVNGTATIRGAAVAEQALAVSGTSGNMQVNYDKAVLTTLRVSYGTFVRVPGSWRDFERPAP